MQRVMVKKYRERKILRRIFASICGISTLCIVAACSIAFFWMRTVYLGQMRDNMDNELDSYNLILANYLTMGNNTMELLGKNAAVSRLLVSDNPKWNESMAVAADQIKNIIDVNQELHSIYIMGSGGSLMRVANGKYPLTFDQNEQIENFFYSPGQGRYRLFSYQDSYGVERRLLSIAAGELSGRCLSNGIMVNLDMTALMDRVFPQVVPGESYVLLDQELRVLGYKGEGYLFGEDASEDRFVKMALNADTETGALALRGEDDKQYFLSAARDASNGYHLLHIVPYGSFFSSLRRMEAIIIMAGVAFAALAAGVAVLLSEKLYHPIDQVVELLHGGHLPGQGEAMRWKMESGEEENELSGLSHIMGTMVGQLNQFQMKKDMEEVRRYLSSKGNQAGHLPEMLSAFDEAEGGYRAVVFRVCDVADFLENNTAEAVTLQRQTMCAMLEREMQEMGESLVIPIDDEYLALLLFGGEQADEEELERHVRSYMETVRELLAIQMNAGISDIRAGISEISQAYQNARAATAYRFLYGMNEIITESQMLGCALGGKASYSIKKLMEKAAACDKEGFITEYQAMAGELRRGSVQAAYETLVNLGMEMTRYRKRVLLLQPTLTAAEVETVRQELLDFQYIGEAQNWFLDLLAQIAMELTRVNNGGSGDIVREVTAYLGDHYMDINLSAQFMAEKCGITPSYFSRIFKEHCGCAFPDYLSGLRLEKARQMLIGEPDRNIQSICEAVGYLNSSYFTSMFKKKYGMTPSKYRNGAES